MAVKRHAICGTLEKKVRHIYDVTVLFERPEIQNFLNQRHMLKSLIQKTKQTDGFYLEKRNVPKEYQPMTAYDFSAWESCFNERIRARYESLHMDLLYTNEKQDFEKALGVFRQINALFAEMEE